ncbi:MAG: hypothetical protein WAU69_03150 [Solirubrobacteraceae bacterium]
MNTRLIVFIGGLLLLMLLCGYVRDLGVKAGLSPAVVASLERLALFG